MVCQTLGIEGWLDWLEREEPELLEAQFIALPAILRSEYDIQRWQRQAMAAATDIRLRAEVLAEPDVCFEETLDITFPMSTGHQNCLRPSRCPYLELCFRAADPEDREQFVERTYNHPQEAELVQLEPVGAQ